jgi:hypothetical protein
MTDEDFMGEAIIIGVRYNLIINRNINKRALMKTPHPLLILYTG